MKRFAMFAVAAVLFSGLAFGADEPGLILGQSEESSIPEVVLAEFKYLIGNWIVDYEDGKTRGSGISSVKWASGNHALICEEEWNFPVHGKLNAISLNGWDTTKKEIVTTTYFSDGGGAVRRYKLESPSVWEGQAEHFHPDGTSERSQVRIERSSSNEFTWIETHRESDHGPQPDVRVRFRRKRGRLIRIEQSGANEIAAALSSSSFVTTELRSIYSFTADGKTQKITALGGSPRGIGFDKESESIYFHRFTTILELDRRGKFFREIQISPGHSANGFTVLPDRRFAMLNNRDDVIHVLDSDGNLIRTVGMLHPPDSSLQNTHGIVVRNDLIISEDGRHRILKLNLTTYEVSALRELPEIRPWLGAIAYQDGTFYICGSTSIYSFSEEGEDLTLVADIGEGNITGLVVDGDTAYVTINGTGNIHKVEIESGDSKVIVAGLTRPSGLIRIPGLK